MPQKTANLRKLTVTAMLAAVATVLMFLDFSLPMFIPGFVKMDISELPALLASFGLGPVYGIAVCLVKNLFNLIFHGSTGGIGEVCNFLLGAAFVGTAGLLYKAHKTRKRAILASLAGAAVMALEQAAPDVPVAEVPVLNRVEPVLAHQDYYRERLERFEKLADLA